MNTRGRHAAARRRGRPRAPGVGAPDREARRWGAGRGVRGRGDPGAKRGFRATPPDAGPRRLTCWSVGFPIARIQEVVSDGAEAELRDERHDSLVVVAADHLAD